MPIADTELNKPSNAHLVRPASESIYAALQIWRSQPNSYEWWWLIIEHADRRYTAIRFESLRQLLQNPASNIHMNSRLADLPSSQPNPKDFDRPLAGVVTPIIVEQDAMGTARALQTMEDSPGRVLVVLNRGQFRGILAAAERTFAFADKPLIDLLDEFEVHGNDDTVILPRPDLPASSSSTAPIVPDAPEG